MRRTYVDNLLDVWSIDPKLLSLPEKAVLSNLCRRANPDGTNAYPSKARIAVETSQSIKTVDRVLTKLTEKGYITRKLSQDGAPRGSAFGHYTYNVNVMKVMGEAEDGEELTKELLQAERDAVRDRVAAWRLRNRGSVVTDTESLVTDSLSLRNGHRVVTVTDSQAQSNDRESDNLSHRTATLPDPSTSPLIDPPLACQPRTELKAASRETRSPAIDTARALPARGRRSA